jgi:hypothetical protein
LYFSGAPCLECTFYNRNIPTRSVKLSFPLNGRQLNLLKTTICFNHTGDYWVVYQKKLYYWIVVFFCPVEIWLHTHISLYVCILLLTLFGSNYQLVLSTLLHMIFFGLATCLLAGFLLNLFLWSWRWRQYVPSKRRLTLNGQHGIMSQKMMIFITTAVKISTPTLSYIL